MSVRNKNKGKKNKKTKYDFTEKKKKHKMLFFSLFQSADLCPSGSWICSSVLHPYSRIPQAQIPPAGWRWGVKTMPVVLPACSSCLFFLLCISEVARWLRIKGTQVKNPGRFVLPVFAQVLPAGGRREVGHRSECCWTSCHLFQTKTPPTSQMLHAVWHTLVPPHPTLISPIPQPCALTTAAYFHLLPITSSALCRLASVTLELIKENKKGSHRYLKSMLSIKNQSSKWNYTHRLLLNKIINHSSHNRSMRSLR